ncbi:MAG: succinate-semialdehyde dehydrogenase (NADP(+)) [Candidatus Nanopelagicales bacterium]|nr:succinate-semialdehyde dehydrogenase (NADP(+)) [Candidatus Nanopelagicales bacterium]MCF8539567.1 succinate-semialdehyde dehydrogenase (NADP(+)) [Candidatus Nanopelagicales bacterium]MCF8551031.1 succinate-semialdehyde dehydrogenase (NADP(+)) [Candidatus Nanopelagicales bacterium]
MILAQKHYWDGARARATATSGTAFTVRSPFGPELYELEYSTAADVNHAVNQARQAQTQWAALSLRSRARIFLRFHDQLLKNRDEILDLIQWETGKPRKDANEELLDVALNARYYARHLGVLRERRHMGAFPGLITAIERHVPLGVVGIISPWNYPLTLSVSDAIPALLAGNGVVIKPDPLTSLTALYVSDLLIQSGLPQGLFGIVIGDGRDLGTPLINDIDFLMFTGSTAVGRIVAAQCGERLIGASLELGGKNAMIIRADADINKAAEIATRACFGNTGQLCISIERLYVHESIKDSFLAEFVRRTQSMVAGTTIGWGSDYGPLISAQHAANVLSFISDAQDKGATVHTGGHLVDVSTIAPTILTGVSDSMRVCRSETFGPVVAVESFTTDQEAIDAANDSTFGLNASVISRNRKAAVAMARHLRAGTVNINEGYATAWSTMSAPMGGFGDSGLGRRHGLDGILQYTEGQNIAIQRALGFGPPFGLTDRSWGELLTTSLGVMKKIGWR